MLAEGTGVTGYLTIPSVYVLGLGIGKCITSLCDVAIGDVTQDEAGSASGSFQRRPAALASAIGAAIATSIYFKVSAADGGVTAMTVSSFTVAMIIVACLGLVWPAVSQGCGRVSADAAAGPCEDRDVRGTEIPDMAAGREAAGVVARTALFERLGASARVTMVSAPPGSGKTVLLRSWIGQPGLAERAAWVPRPGRSGSAAVLAVGGSPRCGRRRAGVGAGAAAVGGAGSGRVGDRRAAADGPGAAGGPVWLVIDDVHELGADQALRQLELLVMRAPPQLRFVLATRHDVRLGLHRLRLEGELAEIRARRSAVQPGRGAGAVRRGRGGTARAGAGAAA